MRIILRETETQNRVCKEPFHMSHLSFYSNFEASKNFARFFARWTTVRRPIAEVVSKPRAGKNYFVFSIFFFIFFNRLNIIRSSSKKYGWIGNFKVFQKMGLLPTDIQTQSRKKLFSIFFDIFLYFLTDLILSDQLYN